MHRLNLIFFLALTACSSPSATNQTPTDPVSRPEAPNAVIDDTSATSKDDVSPSIPEENTPSAEIPVERQAKACATTSDDMACVGGGWFVRGMDDDPHRCEQADQPADKRSAAMPAARIFVETFAMDLYEVTNEAYQGCLKAGKCTSKGPLYVDFSAPKQPVTGVTWYDAQNFCAFVGKRLPTEAEWELAARGLNSETFPWGNDPVDCERAVIKDARGRSCGEIKRKGKKPETGRVMEVGSKPPGRFGLYDMAGNAEEWVADWWTPSYAVCGDACLGENPKGPCDGAEPCKGMTYRAVRGGSWYWPGEHTTGYHRRRNKPSNNPFHHFGFRCAADL